LKNLRGGLPRDFSHLLSVDERIVGVHCAHDALLYVSVRDGGREIVELLVQREELQSVAIVAAVSDDVDVRDRESAVWGLFTRFDCERDVFFTHQKLIGASPVYRGVMGIDATWKPGYPGVLAMNDDVRNRVEQRWDSYWR
jgi:4-hydroxy-3-polyprenylbenzoate decarboxylase